MDESLKAAERTRIFANLLNGIIKSANKSGKDQRRIVTSWQ